MPATTLAASATPALPVNDFADWFSPILVKELRQGLKSRAFVSSFIVVQIVMIVLVGLQLLAREDHRGGYPRYDGFSGFFWAVIWVPLLVLMPARGLGAVSEEARANTFDLVQLTRLTAFRIVAGKWVALVAQTVLLVTSVLPYAVLRYFFGGVDIVTDLTVIGLMLTGSVVLTDGAIALSTAHLAVRLIVLVAALPLMTTGFGIFSMLRAFGGMSAMGFSAGPDASWWFITAAAGAYVFMFLEFAASKIAPVVENHSARKRLAALLIAGICVAVAWLGTDDMLGLTVVVSVPLLGWVVVESLTEAGSALPATYAPFAKRGFPGRIAGRVFYPGWGPGIIFSAMVIALIFSAMQINRFHHPLTIDGIQTYLAFWPMLFFALISPLPVMLFFPRVRQRFWLYVLIQLVFVLIFVAAGIAADGRGLMSYYWTAFSPTSALIAMLSHSDEATLAMFFSRWTSAAGLVILAILLVQMFRDFRFMSHLERLALKQQAPDP